MAMFSTRKGRMKRQKKIKERMSRIREQKKVLSSSEGSGSAGDLFRKTPKTTTKAGSYSKKARKGYEKMLAETGKY
ncbi:MAG: hypothetical protein GY938_25820 [Ketobacter sp.]|nr:hypothetical protein [Ketobacter sp.]